jgi:arylsulfatase A-like enzyme
VVTADHGEGFAPELRRVHHAGRLHDDLLFVPLMMRWPGRLPVAREERRVTTLDVMPTVLALAHVAAPPSLRGRPLFTPARGFGALVGPLWSLDVHPQPSVAEESAFLVDPDGHRHLSTVRQAAIVARGLKLISAHDTRELYAPGEDPEERANLAAARPADAARLDRRLGRILPHLGADAEPIRAETTEQLRALGYIR